MADDAVLHSVEGIARVHYGLVQRVDFGLRQRSVVLHQFDGPFDSGGMQMDMRIRGSAGRDRVEIVRKARGFDQPLSSAGGAAVVIGILAGLCRRNAAVISLAFTTVSCMARYAKSVIFSG